MFNYRIATKPPKKTYENNKAKTNYNAIHYFFECEQSNVDESEIFCLIVKWLQDTPNQSVQKKFLKLLIEKTIVPVFIVIKYQNKK